MPDAKHTVHVQNIIENTYLKDKSEDDRKEYEERKKQYKKWNTEFEAKKAKEAEEKKKNDRVRGQAQSAHNNRSPPRRQRNAVNPQRPGLSLYISLILTVYF